MKHRVAGRKLGRTSEHRIALLRNLSTELLDKERIRTTLGKAKELRPFAEKMITLSKRETLHARRQVLRHVHDRDVVAKLFDTLSARYAQRPGGYTRIIKLGPRRGDNAEMALIELVGNEDAARAAAPPKTAKGAKGRRGGKAPEAAAAAPTEEAKQAAPAKKKKPAARKTGAKKDAAGAKKASASGAKSTRKTAVAKKGSSRGA